MGGIKKKSRIKSLVRRIRELEDTERQHLTVREVLAAIANERWQQIRQFRKRLSTQLSVEPDQYF